MPGSREAAPTDPAKKAAWLVEHLRTYPRLSPKAVNNYTGESRVLLETAVGLLGHDGVEGEIRDQLIDHLAAADELDEIRDDPPATTEAAVARLVQALTTRHGHELLEGDAAEQYRSALTGQPVEVKRALLRELFALSWTELPDDDTHDFLLPVFRVVGVLLDDWYRHRWADDTDEAALMAWFGTAEGCWSHPVVADIAGRAAARGDLPPLLLAAWRREKLQSHGADLAKLPGEPLLPFLNAGEAWADRAISDLAALPAPDHDAWQALVRHATTATSAKPSAKWLKTAHTLLAAVDADTFAHRLTEWLSLLGHARTVRLRRDLYGRTDPNPQLDSYNGNALRGLMWLLTILPASAATARVVGGVVETALKRAPGVGPRSPKVANAGVYTLSKMDGEAALGQLARLASRITYKATSNEVGKALDARAAALGLSREEVDELAIPTYGLTDVGGRTEKLGEVTAEITVVGDAAALRWRNSTGKVVKSPPASVKRDHKDDLAELKASVKDIGKMLAAQRERLDRMILDRRSWRYGQWRERYLDHPLMGTLARRLVWVVGGTACCWREGALRDRHEAVISPADDAEVTLWHPIGRDVAEVTAWREWLEGHEITQPFKQAHREVYLLTDAERTTGVYSNRFAAHIVRQHQYHQLAKIRGWNDQLRLMVDAFYPATSRLLPRWGLRAEYWVTGAGDQFNVDTTDSGTYLRLATDQVRFYRIAAPLNTQYTGDNGYEQRVGPGQEPAAPLPLADIPPLVLSEVMRDIDLFVGVASVGNDPTWSDGGPENRYREYWHSYSFGELSATAQTRRDLLARLVPRLAIADRCQLTDRFLEVRGDLRTYKIHLGSGNILMSPDNQYLCIVPAGLTDRDEVRLPFEGDRTLALVLSKAFLLAADTSITDPTIISQIRE